MTVTASRIEQPASQINSSLSVVSKEDIDQVSAIHISELLNRVPGVWITRGNGQESLTAIRSPVLTGAGSCGAFYIAEHGVPVRPTGFCNVNQLFDINAEQAEHIEVIRGPGSAIHGSDALHGVINVFSPAPAPFRETAVSLEAGPNDYGRIKASHSDGTEQLGFRINFNGATDGGYQDDSGFDQQKLTTRFDYQGSEWNSMTLFSASNLNQETAGYVVGADAYKDDDLRTQNPNPEAYRDTQSLRWQTHFERSLSDGAIVVTPYARYSEMEFMMHFLPGDPVEENGQNSIGIQTAYLKNINTGLSINYGIDGELTQAYLKQTQESPSLWFLPQGKQYDYEVDAALIAGYVQADYQWTEKLTLIAGTRYESLKYDYNNQMISGNTDEDGNECTNGTASGCRYTRPYDRSDTFNNLSANGGFIYHVNDLVTSRFKISHGFRAPQATELYRLQSGQVVADLDSEELNSVELTLSGDSSDFYYGLTAFFMKKNNVIFQSSSRENLDNGKTRHQGLEYDFGWDITEHWKAGLGGTFARHKYDNSVINESKGNDIVSAPRRMSSMQLAWLPDSNTRLELEWVSMGKYYTDIFNEHSYPGHDLLHLRLRQQVTENVGYGLRLTNLTGKDYAERADYSGFVGDRYFVGQPRSLFGDIQVQF